MGSIHVPAISLETAVNDSGKSIWLGPDEITRVSIHAEYGDITGSFTVEGSNDPRAHPYHPAYSSADWYDITSSFGLTNPAGSASGFITPYDNCNYEYLRISYTHSSGTGVLRVWVSGR